MRFPIQKEDKNSIMNSKYKLNDPQGLVRKFKETNTKKKMDHKDKVIQDIALESDYFNKH